MQPPLDPHLLEFKFPYFKEIELKNGLKLIVVENHSLPKIYIRLGFDFGIKNDPEDKSGLMQLLGNTIKKGTKKLTYSQIVNQIEQIGGEIDTQVSEDFFIIYGV